jgi:hypothetical protein
MARADWGRLLDLASQQYGVFTVTNARVCSINGPQLTRQVRCGRIRRAYRGVYVVAGTPDTWRQRAMAAVAATGSRAALDRYSAAYLHGLFEAEQPERISVVVPREVRLDLPGVTIRRSSRLPAEDVTTEHQLPVTTIERTICDLAPIVHRGTLRAIVLHAWRKRWTTPGRIDACRLRMGAACTSVELRLLLAALAPELVRMRSVEEGEAFLALTGAGLPAPSLNLRIWDPAGGRWFELDLAYPECLLAIEIDGRFSHTVAPDVENDRIRQARLEQLGWTVIRVPAWEVRHPDRWLPRVRQALRELGHPAVA